MKPHDAFNYSRPDEVAECWDEIGLTNPLYAALWNKGVAAMSDRGRIEIDDGVFATLPAHDGGVSVADVWDVFSKEEQAALNAAAEKREAEWRIER